MKDHVVPPSASVRAGNVPTHQEKRMKKASVIIAMATWMLWAGTGSAAIVFQDTFTGTNETPFDSTKWLVTGSGTAWIQSNQGQVCNYGIWQNSWAYSKTGANFLNPQYSSVVYSGTLDGKGGYYDEGYFGVQDAAILSYSSGQWAGNLSLNLTIGSTYVGSFQVDATTAPAFTITLTPTAYTVTLSNVLSGPTSYTGAHGLSSGSYAGGGLWYLRHQSNADTWAGVSSMTLDNLTTDVVPEPASLALLGLGGLFYLRRPRR